MAAVQSHGGHATPATRQYSALWLEARIPRLIRTKVASQCSLGQHTAEQNTSLCVRNPSAEFCPAAGHKT
eukprot:1131850-Amphidinium_carterae.1